MKTLVSQTLNPQLSPQSSAPIFLFHFPSLSRTNPNYVSFSHRKWLCTPKTRTSCSTTVSVSMNYGGWDDLRFPGNSVHSGESNQLRTFLNSLGIDDKKYIFVYLLGFVCALAISRFRVSSIIVFPACLIVFAVGFSIGFVNGGQMSELSLTGTKKKSEDENVRGSIEQLWNLLDIFNEFDDKIVKLKNDIKRGIECNQITVDNLESYITEMGSIGSSALDARKVVEGCIDTMLVENQEVERTSNQMSSKRRKEVNGTGFDWSQFIVGLFRENSVGSKANKRKDLVKEPSDMEINDHRQGNILAPAVEERTSNSVLNGHIGNDVSFGHTYEKPELIHKGDKELINGATTIKLTAENENMNKVDANSSGNNILDSEADNYRTNRLQFMNNQRTSLNMDHQNEVETRASHDDLLSVSLKHMKTEASFIREQTFKKLNGNYRTIDSSKKCEKEPYRSYLREEKVIPDDDPAPANYHSTHESDFSSSASPMVTDDVIFNRYLMEANSLLKQAKECVRRRDGEEQAENALYKSARLLSRAIDMKPMSLLAVGQLGNTYLLHGELKLKMSRELRALLARNDPLLVEKWGQVLKRLDDQVVSKDKIISLLINVCEECEELLVEAGRKYKFALSIDGNDMRALYNWGLALSFRAQLIADIGPDAALDADKVFLAAIDKFDAMMSKSNVYAPDALFRWGATIQQRSRLRPRNSKEKVKLLQQAKRLYEDALDMDSDNLQVREALSSCISEIDCRNY